MKVQTIRKAPSRRRITGQGMTEYIIVLALVALAAVVAVGFFGDAVQAQFGAMASKLVGEDASGALQSGAAAATSAAAEANTSADLKTYAE